ncbi:spherulation-specific family 4 protein [Streptomyces sp. NPDC006368]|uniref:spherulation-specific family 4 protein n=1 Tax=Streptomyces sp. NPDC006368 TaxID=3156760 RepID=UPI0033AE67D2
MPHLTPTGTGLSATGADRLGFGVPGYAHPLLAPVEWAELTRPGTPLHWAVLNVADGPGTRPDPHCLEAAGRVRNAFRGAARSASSGGGGRMTGRGVLGHLDMRHGARPFGELVSDAQRFVDWYRVDGFLLDRCPTDRADLAAVRRTTATLEAVLDHADGGHLVLGHGSHPDPGYARIADQLVTFSGSWADYRWSQAAEWTADHPPERFVHLVHGVPRTHLDEAMRIARWQGAGTIFFTDRTGQSSPFAALPGYWDEIVSRIGPGVSE